LSSYDITHVMFSCIKVCEEYTFSQNGFPIRLPNSTQKRSKEPKKLPPSLYKEMQVFWAKPSKSVWQAHNLVLTRMLFKLS
jgi:hypothetical protein